MGGHHTFQSGTRPQTASCPTAPRIDTFLNNTSGYSAAHRKHCTGSTSVQQVQAPCISVACTASFSWRTHHCTPCSMQKHRSCGSCPCKTHCTVSAFGTSGTCIPLPKHSPLKWRKLGNLYGSLISAIASTKK